MYIYWDNKIDYIVYRMIKIYKYMKKKYLLGEVKLLIVLDISV